MPGGAIDLPQLAATTDVARVEAPVTLKAYLMCVFGAFGGIFFGYDSGYIGGVLGMPYVIQLYTGLDPATTPASQFVLPAYLTTLLVSILSAGTFFGALMAGDMADFFGRRTTIIMGCFIYGTGVVLQVAQTSWGLLVAGRLVAGWGVGFVSAIIILYLSEIAPRKVRGAIVSGYQFCITIGLFLAACIDYATKDNDSTSSYRVPIALQFAWAIILATGLFLLPESPRYFVKKGQVAKAVAVLSRLRGQPAESEYVQAEVAEIVANHEYELSIIPQGSYFSSWANCFKGSLFRQESNLRRTILGTSLQMMQQWTGVNFVFYFGTIFFQSLGSISNPFLITVITSLVNVLSTPISFYTIERFGRRTLLIWGAIGMFICQYIVAIVGDATDIPNGSQDHGSTKVMIAFICIYIFFFASTWGPGAWVVIGEIFPLPIRSRGVALSTASNWLWNCIIGVITPYLVNADKANLSSNVFWLWGSLCGTCRKEREEKERKNFSDALTVLFSGDALILFDTFTVLYAYLLVPETKGLSLEQVDRMMEECSPRNSARWKPTSTFAADLHAVTDKGTLKAEIVEDIEKQGSAV